MFFFVFLGFLYQKNPIFAIPIKIGPVAVPITIGRLGGAEKLR